ncbi:MAG TPA: hypothetical protein VGF37_06755, partial [Chthoniobacterales bacterium]
GHVPRPLSRCTKLGDLENMDRFVALNWDITEPRPTIKANLASMGDVDPKSVEMRISGFGVVPAIYASNTKLVTYGFTQKLVPKMYTVILTAKVNGKKVETRWDFTVDPAGSVAP